MWCVQTCNCACQVLRQMDIDWPVIKFSSWASTLLKDKSPLVYFTEVLLMSYIGKWLTWSLAILFCRNGWHVRSAASWGLPHKPNWWMDFNVLWFLVEVQGAGCSACSLFSWPWCVARGSSSITWGWRNGETCRAHYNAYFISACRLCVLFLPGLQN